MPKIKVANPVQKQVTEWDEYTGRFQAIEKVDVRARVSGYLEAINFKDGDMVKAGDVLFVIDQRPFKIALDDAKAQMNRAIAQRELSKKNLERAKKLFEMGAISRQDYDNRIQDIDVNEAAVAQAEAAVDAANLNLDFTYVLAPVSGRVSRHFVSEGNLISGGSESATVLTTIVSTNPIYFYIDASESELLKYIRLDKSHKRTSSRTKANPVYVKLLDEKDFEHTGHMDFVDNAVDESTGTMRARAVIDNSSGILEPGMFGRAKIPGSANYDALLVPDEAIGSDQSLKFLYVVDDQNTVKIKFVELGPLEQGLRIIRQGITADDRIIISNLVMIRPEMKIDPVLVNGSELTKDAEVASR